MKFETSRSRIRRNSWLYLGGALRRLSGLASTRRRLKTSAKLARPHLCEFGPEQHDERRVVQPGKQGNQRRCGTAPRKRPR